MKPLFHKQTELSLEQFAKGNHHACIIYAPVISGIQTLVSSMHQQLNSNQPDTVIVVKPEGNAIGIDAVRELKKNFSLKAVGNERRIIHIYDAGLMTQEAQNALLKLLEEPPEDVRIVLSVRSTDQLLPTILSRAASIALLPVTEQQAIEHYTKQGFSEEEIKTAYAISDGLPTALVSLLSGENTELKNFIEEAKSFIKLNRYEKLLKVDEYSKEKEKIMARLEALQLVYRAAIRSAAKQGREVANLVPLHRMIIQAEDALLKNVNTKIVVTNLFLKI